MKINAVVVEPETPGRLVLRPVDAPSPASPTEALVDVKAISLNRGEIRRAFGTAPAGWRPGWDFAGVVEAAAADGSGPQAGTRVVGMLRAGAWAERIAADTSLIAAIPDSVTFAQAATLPVAGLTALHSLYKARTPLIGRSVLVTGATGGVGDFAIQLAKRAGATVTAHLRRETEDGVAFARAAGADHLAIGERLADAAKPFAPFDLIVESVGGETLGSAMTMLAERGVCVSFGTSAGNSVTFDAQDFYYIGGATLYGLILFDELKWEETAAVGLARLGKMIADGTLSPQISVESDCTQIAAVAQDLLDRKYLGKAVLKVAD